MVRNARVVPSTSSSNPARVATFGVADLFSHIRGHDPVFLLGAGASVHSGIPTSPEMVWLALRWLFAAERGWVPDDPRITRSDLRKLLIEEPWYEEGLDLADLLPHAIEAIGRPRDRRREFLLDIIAQVTTPSVGYDHLARLMKRRDIRTVLTSNFDDLLPLAHGRGGLLVVENAAGYGAISTNPSLPQVVFLHGKAEYYLDRALPEEVAHLDASLAPRLLPLLRDHPLVICGYRGAEPSIMRDLLLANVDAADRFRHGIFWCVRSAAEKAFPRLHPLVRELAHVLGLNFGLVPAVDFDGLMTELAGLWEEQQRMHLPTPDAHGVPQPRGGVLPFDLQPTDLTVASELGWDDAESRLRSYCVRMDIPIDGSGPAWIETRLTESGLSTRLDGMALLTRGGALLVGRMPRRAAAGAYVELCLPGRPPRSIDGDLWKQHEQTMAALGEVNRPIRLKGRRSAVVRAYPEEALKEVLANHLIHRDYTRAEPTRVIVRDDAIQVVSPGGLEPDLLRRLLGRRAGDGGTPYPTDLLQRHLALGDRGTVLTGYRNPTLADLFYGTGIVDKAGSGLADALLALEAAGGRLVAEISADNGTFTTTLFRRPTVLDGRSATARPAEPTQTMQLNLLEVTSLPPLVWSGTTNLRFGDLREDALRVLPPHVLYDGRLFTFADLSRDDNPLRVHLSGLGDIQPESLDRFGRDDVGERRLVHLMHEVLFRRLRNLRLQTDWDNKLTYFSCLTRTARYVVYRSRAHERQRRRVAHWPGEIARFCEHKAAHMRFERFGPAWALVVLPTYVFTRDGLRDRIVGAEASSLATSASTDDYNLKVLFDVIFWASILSDGARKAVLDGGLGAGIELDTGMPVAEVAPLPGSTTVIDSASPHVETSRGS